MAMMMTMIDPDVYWRIYRELFRLMADNMYVGWAVMFGLGFFAAWAIFAMRRDASADKKNEYDEKNDK